MAVFLNFYPLFGYNLVNNINNYDCNLYPLKLIISLDESLIIYI